MLRHSLWRAAPKGLQHMFRKLKLAGAHPDVLWSIDSKKAQHNGEEMIRLETLMHQRETNALQGRNVPHEFLFWLKTPAAAGGEDSLRSVACTITPAASSRIVKQQMAQLFQDAGILEDFELGGEGVEMNLESMLRYADVRQTEHIYESGALYLRGERSIENLRRFGVLLVIEEDGHSYLVTLPDVTPTGGTESSEFRPARSLVGPNGEIDPDAQTFMRERHLKPFDLRMAGGHSSVERFVGCFERIERMYEVHRGGAMRSSVCLVLSLKSLTNFVSEDGCIVLSVMNLPTWEEYLLSLPQTVWRDCVQKHRDWRIGYAPKMNERKRQLKKIADMFGFFNVVLEARLGFPVEWHEHFIARMSREEMVVRNAVKKYGLKSDLLKNRGELHILPALYSSVDRNKEIGYRVSGDGKLFFNYRTMTTPQMLRVLKDNLKRLETFQKQHDDVISTLEHVSRSVPIDFSVDTEWKPREEGNLVNCLQRFMKTIKTNEGQLSAFLRDLLQMPPPSQAGGRSIPKKRMVWIISDRLDTLPSGILFVPWDVDFESIKKLLLPQR